MATKSGSNTFMDMALDLRGLDMVTPTDLLKNGHTPFSKNFRLFAQQADDRKVAVSSRKGPGHYVTPVGAVLEYSNVATTGASTVNVGVVQGVHMQPFTATSSNRISRIDIQPSDPTSTVSGPLLVQIYDSLDGKPHSLLTESSILGGDIGSVAAWKTARFINAVKLNPGSQYWIVLVMQDDGIGQYSVSTTTAGTPAFRTDTSLYNGIQQLYSINYRIYTSTDQMDKGAYRFARDNGQNLTVAAFGTTMYKIDDTTKTFIKLIDGLNANATDYRFTNGDNKVFWVNGYDELTAWNGTDESQAINLIGNPSFSVNTVGYSAISGSTITRNTTDFNTTPASLSVTASSGIRGVSVSQLLPRDHRYKVSYFVKGSTTTGTTYITVNGGTTAVSGSSKALTTGWTKNEFYYAPGSDVTTFEIKAGSDNIIIDDVTVIDTGIEYIRDTELPILSDLTFHKDRLFGKTAADENKMVFSENPGNPAYNSAGTVPTTAREQWYYAWLSVSFIYVPRPHNGSPITAIISFQDSLIIFTQDNKYVLSGSDRGSFSLRQSTGSKGAISRRGVINDENSIYFVSDDGFYLHNGSSDQKISTPISPLIDGCPRIQDITPVIWKNQVRFYLASNGSPVNDTCVIMDKDLQEWMYDTDTYVNRALYYNDADDDHQLVEFSSQVGTAYLAEQDYNSLGGPIDFDYRLKYDSFGSPMQRKRLKRYYPILQGVDSTFNIQLAMDKDFEDSPRIKEQLMSVNGAKIGQFKFGDGTLLGGDKSFKPKRQSYSGYAYYWQLRVQRKAVNNRVAFTGAQYSYKTKRL